MSSLIPASSSSSSPSSLSSSMSPLSRMDSIRLISFATALFVGYSMNSERVVSSILNAAARILIDSSHLHPPPSSSPSSSSSSHLLSKIQAKANEFNDYVDRTSYQLHWRGQIRDFDDKSPIKHTTIVKVVGGVVIYLGVKGILSLLLK